jgi:hypothetical protein
VENEEYGLSVGIDLSIGVKRKFDLQIDSSGIDVAAEAIEELYFLATGESFYDEPANP